MTGAEGIGVGSGGIVRRDFVIVKGVVETGKQVAAIGASEPAFRLKNP
jgi:KaiC/GvpD/RAD55 family RecA-like ATPase